MMILPAPNGTLAGSGTGVAAKYRGGVGEIISPTALPSNLLLREIQIGPPKTVRFRSRVVVGPGTAPRRLARGAAADDLGEEVVEPAGHEVPEKVRAPVPD